MQDKIEKLYRIYQKNWMKYETTIKSFLKESPSLAFNAQDLDLDTRALIQSSAFFISELQMHLNEKRDRYVYELLHHLAAFYTSPIVPCAVVQLAASEIVVLKKDTVFDFKNKNDANYPFKFTTIGNYQLNNYEVSSQIVNAQHVGINVGSKHIIEIVVKGSSDVNVELFCNNMQLVDVMIMGCKNAILACNCAEKEFKIKHLDFSFSRCITNGGVIGDGPRMLMDFFILPETAFYFHLKAKCNCLEKRIYIPVSIEYVNVNFSAKDFILTNVVILKNVFFKTSESMPFQRKSVVRLDYKSRTTEDIVDIHKVYVCKKSTGGISIGNNFLDFKQNFTSKSYRWLSSHHPSYKCAQIVHFLDYDAVVEKDDYFIFCKMLCSNKSLYYISKDAAILDDAANVAKVKSVNFIERHGDENFEVHLTKFLISNYMTNLRPKKISSVVNALIKRCGGFVPNDHTFISKIYRRKTFRKKIMQKTVCNNIVGQSIIIVFDPQYLKSSPCIVFIKTLANAIKSFAELNTFNKVIFKTSSGKVIFKA